MPRVIADAGASYPWGAGPRTGEWPFGALRVGLRPLVSSLGLGGEAMQPVKQIGATPKGEPMMGSGIFGGRATRWGPGMGIFKDKYAIPQNIYTESAYAGGYVTDASEQYREHGLYGFGAGGKAAMERMTKEAAAKQMTVKQLLSERQAEAGMGTMQKVALVAGAGLLLLVFLRMRKK